MLELLTLLATCSPPPPGYFDTRPPPGSALPANAEIVLVGYGWDPGTSQVTISQLDAIYDVTPIFENGVARVDVGALGIRGAITLFATSTEPNAMSVTADFTIEDVVDTTAPTFSGISGLTYEYMESMPGLCWPGGFGVRAQITPASDDWATTYYSLYEVMPNDALQWVGSTYHADARSLGITHYAGYDEGTRCYVAYANDVGGNVTPDVVRGGQCIDLRLEGSDAGVNDAAEGDSSVEDSGTVVDTGVRDTGVKPDAGTPDSGTGGELELDEDEGCGCTAVETESLGSFLIWGLLLPFVRRRSAARSRAR